MIDQETGMVQGWVLSFAFPSLEEAGPIYERVRDLVFDRNLEAGVYRTLVKGQAHVVVLGFAEISEEISAELRGYMTDGTDSELPEPVLFVLAAQHAQLWTPGMKYEQRGSNAPTIEFN